MVRRYKLHGNPCRLGRNVVRQDINIKNYWKIIVLYGVELWEYNSGFTHTDYNKKLSIVGISKTTSNEQLLNTISHEAKHIQSNICKYYNIKEDGEAAAYLLGYVVGKMYQVFKRFI